MTRTPLSEPTVVDRLGADLRAAGYDSVAVPDLLGRSAHRALGRGEPAPALRATRDGSALSTLIRLFLLGATEDQRAVGAALGRTGIADAVRDGVLESDGTALRAALDIRPYSADGQEYLLVSDLDSDTRPGPVREDHVLGLGAASITLARAVVRQPVQRALDVGTGSGIQALHLAGHAEEVVATDTNPRALALAAATARLNGQQWDLRAGSLFEPVADEAFDLIVCNPPFVIGDGEQRFSYRDSGVAGDGLCRALVGGITPHLRPGGTAQLLANWIVRDGSDWRERVGGWVSDTGCDAWVVQRELADPAEYVGLWLSDAGEDARSAGPGRTGSDRDGATALAERWLDYFAAENVVGIGMGMITLQRNDSHDPSVTLDELTGPDEDLTGDEVDGFFRRRAWVEGRTDADLLASRLALSPQVMLEQRSLSGHEGGRRCCGCCAASVAPGRRCSWTSGGRRCWAAAPAPCHCSYRSTCWRPCTGCHPARSPTPFCLPSGSPWSEGSCCPASDARRVMPGRHRMSLPDATVVPSAATAGECDDDPVRAVASRVSSADVRVDGTVVGQIDREGLLVLVGVTHTDTLDTARRLAAKLLEMRILRGDESCASAGAPLLVVSQFTLYARTDKGRRPSWSNAAPADAAEPLVIEVVEELRRRGATVETGVFGATMAVQSVNDGPFTLLIEM